MVSRCHHPQRVTEQMQQHPSRADMASSGVIDIQSLRERFAPTRGTMPEVAVKLPPVASYDMLLPSMGAAA